MGPGHARFSHGWAEVIPDWRGFERFDPKWRRVESSTSPRSALARPFVLFRVLVGRVLFRCFQNTKRNGLPLRSCQPFCCISDVTRFLNHSHARSSSLAAAMSFATLCLTRVHVFGTRQGQLTAHPTQH